jgi:hypothetical protein
MLHADTFSYMMKLYYSVRRVGCTKTHICVACPYHLNFISLQDAFHRQATLTSGSIFSYWKFRRHLNFIDVSGVGLYPLS